MTRQEIYDKVASHLLTQMEKSQIGQKEILKCPIQ